MIYSNPILYKNIYKQENQAAEKDISVIGMCYTCFMEKKQIKDKLLILNRSSIEAVCQI